jgi:hypothetical protein
VSQVFKVECVGNEQVVNSGWGAGSTAGSHGGDQAADSFTVICWECVHWILDKKQSTCAPPLSDRAVDETSDIELGRNTQLSTTLTAEDKDGAAAGTFWRLLA